MIILVDGSSKYKVWKGRGKGEGKEELEGPGLWAKNESLGDINKQNKRRRRVLNVITF
jgi:hypothetical protein